MKWAAPDLELRPVIGTPTARPSWPLGSHEVTAEDGEDGGTFYRPEAPTWHNGTDDPAATAGDEGDYFLNTTDREWWGPKGAEDEETGEGSWPGPYSLPAGTWSNGSGDPADGTGSNGDYYLDTAARAWWGPKAAGSWVDTGPHHIAAGWVDILNGPAASGLFAIPGCAIANGEPAESAAQEAACSLELSDSDGARIALIPIAELSADDGQATGSHSTSLLVDLDKPQTIARARWIITGGVMLTWAASGGLAKLR